MIAVVGPTATGKSDLAIALAEALGGEVVNADAMQLYRGMDIGTAKVPVPERRGIPHHLIDRLDVTQEAVVAAFQREARDLVAAIGDRGSRSLLVGGSGLYVQAVLDRLEFPGTDPVLRAEITAHAEAIGASALHAELAAVDPQAAAVIEPGNLRRVVRALEVVRLTGRPFAARLPESTEAIPALRLGLRMDRAALDRRIDARARAMFGAGLVAETRALLERHGPFSRTAARAVGYAQALDVIAGVLTEAEAADATALATRRLARRQEKWFRRDRRVTWLDADAGPDAVVEAALRRLAR